MKNVGKRNTLFYIIILQLFIYLSFLFVDFRSVGRPDITSIFLKYSGILLCFITSLLIGKDGHSKRDTLLLQFGLFFTSLADLNLLVLNQYIPGVALFCIVQTIYIYRYNPGLSINFIIISLSTILLVLLSGLSINLRFPSSPVPLILLAALYGVLLVLSVINAMHTCKRGVLPRCSCSLVSLGMILFLFCDINVALFSMLSMFNIKFPSSLYLEPLSAFLIWFFYFPSQVMLSLSGYRLILY